MPGSASIALRERAGDGEHHVLLAGTVLADGTGILAAVACVDGDDEIARFGARMLDLDRASPASQAGGAGGTAESMTSR